VRGCAALLKVYVSAVAKILSVMSVSAVHSIKDHKGSEY
jgi:hypothetical protein